MSFFSFFPTAMRVPATALNSLLQRESWARERLSRHAGKSLRLALGQVKINVTIQSDGLLQACDPAVVPDVILTIPSSNFSQLPAAIRSREPAAIAALMQIQGDAGLAHVVSDLARDLRWDVEDQLGDLIGDMAAVRILSIGKSVIAGARGTAQRLSENMTEYLTYESGTLLDRTSYEIWVDDINAALSRLDRLEQHVGVPLTASAGRN